MNLAKHLRGVAKDTREAKFRRHTRGHIEDIKEIAESGGRVHHAEFDIFAFGETYYQKFLMKLRRHGFQVKEIEKESTIYTKAVLVEW
ncbi:hypothetical protein [Bacillus thuringiensis]|uniref:hypothetical protein n=1 Tax=Bacillus thuringiensis TaxID=1428 RepID=UPI000BF4A07B|nr:hypothetical protein [Bacillus thuringiensis]PEV64120.1 hypothetical protein CN434_25265 [Bacillus thuringiensis]